MNTTFTCPLRPPTTRPSRGPLDKKRCRTAGSTGVRSSVSPRGFRPPVPDPSREPRAPLVGLGMKGDFNSHNKIVPHGHFNVSLPGECWELRGAVRLAGRPKKCMLTKFSPPQKLPMFWTISLGLYEQQVGWLRFYKEAYCTVFNRHANVSWLFSPSEVLRI